MVGACIYLEGGGDSKELHTRCREGFSKLLKSAGFEGRMPRLVACGGRGSTFDSFKTAHRAAKPGAYIAMLVDAEDSVADIEKPWEHLIKRDGWERPANADDDQALLMVVCMESWIAADRQALREHYGSDLKESALPAIPSLESTGRHDVQNKLEHATRNCTNKYKKGKRSFEVLGKLSPEVLQTHLAGFRRVKEVLDEKL